MAKKKLKCWRKVNKTLYKHKKGDRVIKIERMTSFPGSGFKVFSERKTDFPAFRFSSIGARGTEKEAIKLAEDFMKKHNVC